MRSQHKFLASNLIVLIIPVLMGTIFYVQTQRLLERRVYESNLRLLEQGRTLVDTELQEFEGIIQQLGVHPRLPELLAVKEPLAIPDLEWLIRFTREDSMFPYSMSNSLILDYFVFVEPGNIVVGPQQALPFETFYAFMVSFEGYDASRWYDEFIRTYHSKEFYPAVSAKFGTTSHRVIPFFHSFGSKANHPVSVLILIDTKALFRLLKYVGAASGGFMLITDQQERVIVSSLSEGDSLPDLGYAGKEEFYEIRLAGRRMLVTQTHSQTTDWRFISAVPLSLVKADLRYIQITTALILAFFLASGLAAAVYLAYKNSKPFVRLMAEKRDMQLALERQLPFLRSALVEKLLNDLVEMDERVELLFQEMRFPVDACGYVVAVVKMRFSEPGIKSGITYGDKGSRRRFDIKRLRVKDVIAQSLDHSYLIHDFDIDKLAVIIALQSEVDCSGDWHTKELFNRVRQNLQSRFPYQTSIGVGSPYSALQRISRSFEEAKVALDYRIEDQAEPVYHFGDLPEQKNNYHYPYDTETRLISFVKSGSRDGMTRTVEELENRNFFGKKLSTDTLRALLFDLHGTLAKIIEQTYLSHKRGTEEQSSELLHSLFTCDPREGFRRISALLSTVCEDVEDQKHSHNTKLREEVKTFLEESYLDHNLCLKQAASQFNVSEHYLSHFIKEQLGKNFFTYIEELRMQQAVRYLMDTQLQIKEIADASGYSSLNSFCRAFKRIYGISPGEYRLSSQKDLAAL